MNQPSPYRIFSKNGITYVYCNGQMIGWQSYLSHNPDFPAVFIFAYHFIATDSTCFGVDFNVGIDWIIRSWEHYYQNVSDKLGDRNF